MNKIQVVPVQGGMLALTRNNFDLTHQKMVWINRK